jgi:hypothetical protein
MVLLEKLTVSQLVKKLPAFYRTRRFITVSTRARHLSLYRASPRLSLFLYDHFNIILPPTTYFFPLVLPPKLPPPPRSQYLHQMFVTVALPSPYVNMAHKVHLMTCLLPLGAFTDAGFISLSLLSCPRARQRAFARTSRGSCRGLGHDKRDTCGILQQDDVMSVGLCDWTEA